MDRTYHMLMRFYYLPKTDWQSSSLWDNRSHCARMLFEWCMCAWVELIGSHRLASIFFELLLHWTFATQRAIQHNTMAGLDETRVLPGSRAQNAWGYFFTRLDKFFLSPCAPCLILSTTSSYGFCAFAYAPMFAIPWCRFFHTIWNAHIFNNFSQLKFSTLRFFVVVAVVVAVVVSVVLLWVWIKHNLLSSLVFTSQAIATEGICSTRYFHVFVLCSAHATYLRHSLAHNSGGR